MENFFESVTKAVGLGTGLWSPATVFHDLTIEIVGSILAVLGGVFLPVISSFIFGKRRAFRQIFGKNPFTTRRLTITLDTYTDSRELREIAAGNEEDKGRFFKVFPDGHTVFFTGASEILGHCSARAAGYLIEGLKGVGSINIRMVSDTKVASEWNGTFVNIGSSASNVKTDHIKHLPQNLWLQEDINGQFRFKDGIVTFDADTRTDKGVILKLANPYFPDSTLIVCAGLGEWGTSGAAWFLSQKWRGLARRFGKKPFLLLVSVAIGSDESASEIRFFGRARLTCRLLSWLKGFWK